MTGLILGVAALGIAGATLAMYWPTINAMRVPRHPVGHQTAMSVAIALAAIGIVLGGSVLGALLGLVAIVVAGMFLFFTLKSKMPHTTPSVRVGQAILDFTAPDTSGTEFRLASLRGTPFLLKFFRGHW